MTRLETINVTAERPRAVSPPVTTVDVAPDVLRRNESRRRVRLGPPGHRHRGPRAGPGPGLRVGRGHPRLLVRSLVRRAAHDRRRADQSPGPRARRGLRRLERPLAGGGELAPGHHGPASPLYGDFSLAGVVEVFTAADAAGTSGSVSGSSYGDAGGWVRSGRRAAGGGCLLAGEGRRQQGWRDNSAYWLGNGAVRGWRRAGRAGSKAASPYGSSWDSPGFVSVDDYNADRLEQAMDPTDGGSAYRGIAHGRFTTVAGETGLEATAWVQRVHSASPHHPRGRGARPERRGGPPDRRRRTLPGEPPDRRGRPERGDRRPGRFRGLRPLRHRGPHPARPHQGLRRPLFRRRRLRPLARAPRHPPRARPRRPRRRHPLSHARPADRHRLAERERSDRELEARRALSGGRRLVAPGLVQPGIPRRARASSPIPPSIPSAAGAKKSAPATTAPGSPRSWPCSGWTSPTSASRTR